MLSYYQRRDDPLPRPRAPPPRGPPRLPRPLGPPRPRPLPDPKIK